MREYFHESSNFMWSKWSLKKTANQKKEVDRKFIAHKWQHSYAYTHVLDHIP